MRFDVARSTTQGNAKTSERGTGDGEFPRFFCVKASNLMINKKRRL